MTMKTSAAGRAALMAREGCRLTAYRDSRGVATIGVGHVDATPFVTVMGMTITQAQAEAFLAADLAPMEAAVNACIGSSGLSQNGFDAAVSLAFNIGASGFTKSTVARKIASGDQAGAADAFMLWVKPPELRGRREAERAQFLTPDNPSLPKVPVMPAILGLGGAGPDVVTLQQALSRAGYSVDADGTFGPATEGAVRAFQAARGLTADGIAGPGTWSALNVPAIAPVTAPPHLLPAAPKPGFLARLGALFGKGV